MTVLPINHDLCLACSSSLPTTTTRLISEKVFTTLCCGQSICAQCVSANPRLTRYNPCLSCLGGVGVIAAGKAKADPNVNMDGAVRDEDTFVLGDDEDQDDDAPPVYQTTTEAGPSKPGESDSTTREASTTAQAGPSRYYIKRSDTLQGIALRFGVNGRELCTLNNLPPSTLTITPHILHTRESILLPLSAKTTFTDLNEPSSDEILRREARRAEKRLQVLTKEVDWRVARAYVAIADAPDHGDAKKVRNQGLEARALDYYLDDAEWETRAGKPHIQGFPYFSQPEAAVPEKASTSRWWMW